MTHPFGAAKVPPMTGTELVTVEAATSTLRSIVGITTGLIGQVRLNGVANAEERQRLRSALAEIRRAEVASAIFRLSRLNIEHVCGLYDLADLRSGSSGYLEALRHAEHASRLLADNLDRFVREAS